MNLFSKPVAFVCGRGALPFVIACSLLMLGLLVLVEANAQQVGQFKYEVRRSGLVTSAAPAAADHLRTGDRIAFERMTPAVRTQWQFPKAGDELTIPVVRNGVPLSVKAEAGRFDGSPTAGALRATGVAIGFILTMALATIVFLLKRRGATLAFYLYAMLMLVKSMQSPLNVTPWPFNFAFNEAIQVVYSLTDFMIVFFAFRIFNVGTLAARRLLIACAVLGVVTTLAWADAGVVQSFHAFGFPGELRYYQNVTDLFFLSVSLGALFYAGSAADVKNHRRVAWIVLGMALPLVNDLTWAGADFMDAIANGAVPLFGAIANVTDLALAWVGPVGAIFVCYGLVSNRVIDFRYALEVTAINTAATFVLLAIFTIVEMILDSVIEGRSKQEYVTAISLIVTAIAMKFVHERIELFSERVLFKRHHRVMQLLEQAAARIYDVTGACEVMHLALDHPREILNLTYAAYLPIESPDIAPMTVSGTPPEHFEEFARAALSRAWMCKDGMIYLVPGDPRSGCLFRLYTTGVVQGAFIYGPAKYDHALSKDELAMLRDISERALRSLNEVALLAMQGRVLVLEAKLAAQSTLAPPSTTTMAPTTNLTPPALLPAEPHPAFPPL